MGVCVECLDINCFNCTFSFNSCQICKDGYVVQYNTGYGVCSTCTSNCSTCQYTPSQCASCPTNFFLTPILSCIQNPTNFTDCAYSNVALVICNSCKAGSYTTGVVATDIFVDSLTIRRVVCTVCPTNCLICIYDSTLSQPNCTSCVA